MKSNRYFLIGMAVGAFVAASLFGVLNIQAENAHAEKPAVEGQEKEDKQGHSSEEDVKKEDKKEDSHAEKSDDKVAKDEDKSEAKNTEKKNEGHGEKKEGKAEASAQDKGVDKKYKFRKNVQFWEELDDDDDESAETEENVKTVMVMPDTCKEFSMYLSTKERKLKLFERKLERQKNILSQLESNFKSSADKFVATESRIKTLITNDPSNFKDNPEFAKMVKLYETISPEEAANLMKNLDLDMTVALLRSMQPKKVSKIMTALDPKISAALSSHMIRGF